MQIPKFLSDLGSQDRGWVQGGLFVALVVGLAAVGWLLRTQPTEFIYSLF